MIEYPGNEEITLRQLEEMFDPHSLENQAALRAALSEAWQRAQMETVIQRQKEYEEFQRLTADNGNADNPEGTSEDDPVYIDEAIRCSMAADKERPDGAPGTPIFPSLYTPVARLGRVIESKRAFVLEVGTAGEYVTGQDGTTFRIGLTEDHTPNGQFVGVPTPFDFYPARTTRRGRRRGQRQ